MGVWGTPYLAGRQTSSDLLELKKNIQWLGVVVVAKGEDCHVVPIA